MSFNERAYMCCIAGVLSRKIWRYIYFQLGFRNHSNDQNFVIFKSVSLEESKAYKDLTASGSTVQLNTTVLLKFILKYLPMTRNKAVKISVTI